MKSILGQLIGAGAIASTLAAETIANSSTPMTLCPGNDKLCFSVSIPHSSASLGSGDIFFRIQAPATYEWASFGQGLEMAGSNIFIIYPNIDKTNVTLSPRLGISEVLPLFNNEANVQLLSGSGIAGGLMTANVRCSNCTSWSGGNMTLTDTTSSWIWAYKAGSGLATNSQTTSLQVHDDMGTLIFDLTKAVGGTSDANPFIANNNDNASTSGITATGISSGGFASGATSMFTAAHGIIMSIAMLVLFPCGVLIRSIVPHTSIWFHAAWQTIALFATIVATGLGASVGADNNKNHSPHALLGVTTMVLLILQPVWGYLQHAYYHRHHDRGPFGWTHRILGGVAILFGIINGGLGLQLTGTLGAAGGTTYILCAAVMGSVYLTIYLSIAFSKTPKNVSKVAMHRPRHKFYLDNVELAAYPTHRTHRRRQRGP